jgi:hypothetical protein
VAFVVVVVSVTVSPTTTSEKPFGFCVGAESAGPPHHQHVQAQREHQQQGGAAQAAEQHSLGGYNGAKFFLSIFDLLITNNFKKFDY